MDKRRFFLLQERCPKSEIPKMMGRIIAHRLLPLQKFAPSVRSRSSDPVEPHNPEDIIKDILPEPILSQNIEDMLSATADNGLKLSLGSLFGVDFTRSNNDKVELETKQVKTYALTNPDEYFEELMENDAYAKEVVKLFAKMKKRHAYFVTGFLTASDLKTTRTAGAQSNNNVKVSVPVSQFVAGPVGSLLDPGIEPKHDVKGDVKRKMDVADEQIFAMSYSLVKFRWRFRRKDAEVGDVEITGPRYARRQELAFRPEDQEEGGSEDDDGDAYLGEFDENDSSENDDDGAGKDIPYFSVQL